MIATAVTIDLMSALYLSHRIASVGVVGLRWLSGDK